MYRLVRTTPDGTEKAHDPVRTPREAAVAASFSLFYNRHATKAQAQRFAARLHKTEVGTVLTHEASGCTFRIERCTPAGQGGQQAAPTATFGSHHAP